MTEHYPRDCEVCDQRVTGPGPWCTLYCAERNALCSSKTHELLSDADAHGDGPMVNALCNYGRKRFGECLHW